MNGRTSANARPSPATGRRRAEQKERERDEKSVWEREEEEEEEEEEERRSLRVRFLVSSRDGGRDLSIRESQAASFRELSLEYYLSGSWNTYISVSLAKR